MSDPRTLGLPAPWTFEGREYLVAPRSFAHEAAFRRWCEQEDLRTLQRHRDNLTELEYQQQLRDWRLTCSSGVWAYPMPMCIQALMSIDGAKYMTYLSLKEHNPSVTQELVERIFNDPGTKNPEYDAQTNPGVPEHLVEPAWEQLQQVRRLLDDPNRQRPAQQQPAAATS